MELRFATSNEHKIEEAREILAPHGIVVRPISLKIHELQTDDAAVLERNKVLKAFDEVGRSVFVEHTGLYLARINDLPGGPTQLFWDKLEEDRFCELFGGSRAIAKIVLGYVDGRRCHIFDGAVEGVISDKPYGERGFQWGPSICA